MAVNFSKEQLECIETHGKNILVSAAAGSGKTAVLVERIIQMVTDESNPLDIDRLLVVTFTNAAAAEMRERIQRAISEKLVQNPGSGYLARQSTLLHNAQITTIDSFSLFIVRNHFNEIGIEPDMRIPDDGEEKLMSKDVMAELMEDYFKAGDEEFKECVEFFCPDGNEEKMEEYIRKLSYCAQSYPWPEDWLETVKDTALSDKATLEEFLDSGHMRYLRGYFDKMLNGCREKIAYALELCEQPDGPYMYGEMIENDLEYVEKILKAEGFEEIKNLLDVISFQTLSRKSDPSVNGDKKERVKSLRDEYKKLLALLGSYLVVPFDRAVLQEAECGRHISTLVDMTLDYEKRMREKKLSRKIMTFQDVEHYALNILLKKKGQEIVPSQVALEYRRHFKEILIDEYQDSNMLQEYLLKSISGEEEGVYNRFMVGDVKQSIYRFRLAKPQLFLEKYNTYTHDSNNKMRIDLSNNYRSRIEVINSVNEIFSKIMDKDKGGLEYDDAAALHHRAEYPENKNCNSELILVDRPRNDKRLSNYEAEAHAVAMRIKELCREHLVTDKKSKELRPVKFSDIVILMRSTSGVDDIYKTVLEKYDIPVYTESKKGYFSAREVQRLLQFLRIIDNPLQDIPLFGTMVSVFGGFSEDELAVIKSIAPGKKLYSVVKQYMAEGEDEKLKDKLRGFVSVLDRYRGLSVYKPIRELLQGIINDFDYLNYVTALPMGEKRRANVEMLLTKASDFEHTSYFGLFHFIRYMEQLEKYEVDFGEADTLDENANVVRIMTIHKSKGLEFPVTFVSCMSRGMNRKDMEAGLIIDSENGVACNYVNLEKRYTNETLRKKALVLRMKEDMLAEELRILYVAFTRAREKLILTGTLGDAEKKLESCSGQKNSGLSYSDYITAQNYLDILMPIIHDVDIEKKIVSMEDIAEWGMLEDVSEFERVVDLSHASESVDKGRLEMLKNRFSYVYGHKNLENLCTKTTVSELKIAAMADSDEQAMHAFEEKEIVPYIPEFRREEIKVDGATRGSAVHRILEIAEFSDVYEGLFQGVPDSYRDFTKAFDTKCVVENLQNIIQREKESLRLPEEYAEIINPYKIANFYKTETAYRMWKADIRGELFREQPFVYAINAGRLAKDNPDSERVLIQGIIDVFFIEEGKIVLLDYKTDVIDSMEALFNRYETQLQYYKEAIEKLMDMPVSEKILYSFNLEKEGKK